MSDKTKVSCCECDNEFEVDEMQSGGEIIECPSCGNCHEVDTDYDDNGNGFWYLNTV